jgi:hypothetical protein
MKTLYSLVIIVFTLSPTLLLSSCEKGQSENRIQQGNTIIQINAISPDIFHILQVRYNNVINAPINVTVAFHLEDGQKKNVQITIPANNKNLQEWSENKFINTWDYEGYLDSTGNNSTPPIDRSWDISSVEIIAVSSPDKEYGFKVLTSNDWSFYEPTDPHTIVSFISNKDTISYSDYDFMATLTQFNNTNSNYYFNFFSAKVMLFSDVQNYPLTQGMTMNIPLMVYKHNSRNYGSYPDGPQAYTNGSTLVLTITKVTDTHFDASFSGNLWSAMQADTLRISHGEIKNALLPERVQ